MTVITPTLVTATEQGHSLLAGMMFAPSGDLSARAGVIAGLALSKTSGMGWSLGTGRGAVQLTSAADGGAPPFVITAAETGSFDAGDAVKDRIDSIIARLVGSAIVIQVLKGDLPSSGSPVAKALPADSERLWNCLIPAGTSVGSGGWNFANATDVRRWAGIGADAGDIKFSGRATAPNGWLLASGQTVSRTIYPDLFAAIGTAFGAGDGSTTFGLPDLRERFPAGVKAGSTEFGTLGQAGGSKTHSHTLSDAGYAKISTGLSRVVAVPTWTSTFTSNITFGSVTSSTSVNALALGGSTDAAAQLPPYVTLTPLIKT